MGKERGVCGAGSLQGLNPSAYREAGDVFRGLACLPRVASAWCLFRGSWGAMEGL